MARRECCGWVLECMSSHLLGRLLRALRQQVYCVWRLTSQLIIEKMQRKEWDDEQAEEVESIMEEGVIEKDMVEELPLAG